MYNYLKELFFKCFLNHPVISDGEAGVYFDLIAGDYGPIKSEKAYN